MNLNGWLRQSRHRAKKHGVTSDLITSDAGAMVAAYDGLCAYCDAPGTALDNPVPLSDGAQNTPANLLPCCDRCKAIKRNRSICWLFEEGHIGSERYVRLIGEMLARRGGTELRAVLRRIIGIA